MSLWNKYYRPQTVDDALAALAQHQGEARVLGGGTDLLLEMQQGRKPPVAAMVDVTAIPDMMQIQEQEGMIKLGAAVTHTQIVRSPLIERYATCLVESCGVIGGPQVRNVATLGGNVAHALPAADGTTALVALDAEVEVASPAGRRWQPILDLFSGPGVSVVDHSRELITRFRFAKEENRVGSAFKRIMRPQGVALPILGCAVWVKMAKPESKAADQEAAIEEVRICLGPVQPVPVRADQAEQALRGRTLADALDDCVAAAQQQFTPRTSKHRATSAYREEMMAVLLRRALPLAVRRALTGEVVPEGVGLQ